MGRGLRTSVALKMLYTKEEMGLFLHHHHHHYHYSGEAE